MDSGLSNCMIDIGDSLMKSGQANGDGPQLISPMIIGQSISDNSYLYGDEAMAKRAETRLTRLMKHGNVTDWDLMEKFLSETHKNKLKLDLANNSVITSHSLNASRETKEKMIEMFFERFNVSSYYTILDSLLSIYSVGKVTGLVLDSGDQISSVVPIFDGNIVSYAQVTRKFGGTDLTSYLSSRMNVDDFTGKQIKEQFCRLRKVVSKNKMQIEDENSQSEENEQITNEVVLPDGSKVPFDESLLYSAEGMFRPQLINKTDAGIHEIVYESLLKTDYDFRRDYVNNLVVTGGNTKFKGFNRKLEKELGCLLPSILKVNCHDYKDKLHSVWFGGSTICNLGTFQSMMISRQEYEENGVSIINRKCV